MRVISLVGAEAFTDPADGTEYQAAAGVFDLPEPLGRELTTHHASLWRELTFHESQIAQAKLEELRNPHNVAPALADLRDRVTELEATVARLAADMAGGTELSSGKHPARATRSRKTAAPGE